MDQHSVQLKAGGIDREVDGVMTVMMMIPTMTLISNECCSDRR